MCPKFSVLSLPLSLALALAACSGGGPKQDLAQEQTAHEHAEEDAHHHHQAPHGGTLVELGDHAGNVEFVLAEDGTLTAYVLDAHAESAVRIEQLALEIVLKAGDSTEPVALAAVGSTLTGETPGDTSEFVAQVQSLAGMAHFEAELKYILYKGVRFENIPFSYAPEKE